MSLQCNKDTDELLYIETEKILIMIKGSASHPEIPGIEFSEKEAELHVQCDEVYDIHLSGDPEEINWVNFGKSYGSDYCLRPLFFEQQRYELFIESLNGDIVEFWHENFNLRKNVTPVGKKGNILSGIINFGNEIGKSNLIVLVNGKNYLKVTIEIFPSKISYKEDYKAIVSDVTAEVYNLAFDVLKKTYDSFNISDKKQSSPVEFFAIIRKIYDDFLRAVDMILIKPHHLLEKEHLVLSGHKVKKTDNQTIRWIEKHPEQALRSGNGVLVANALAVRKYVTYDTKENRLTKYILQNTVKRLENFKRQYSRLFRDTDEKVISEIEKMIREIQRRCNTGFLKEVNAAPSNTGMSLVFNMASGYRELYRCYILLQHGLSLTGGVFNLSVKDMAVLYEYWCFIKLNSLMKEKYQLISQDIIKISGNGLFVALVKGKSSSVKYLNPENGEKIILSYNPKEIDVPTITQRPDNVLKLEKKGSKQDYEYVFDAKYRINAALEGSAYKNTFHKPGPQEGDINTMHRYRDAIVYSKDKGISPYERTMFGAYVLFPYHNEEEYKNHKFYKSIGKVNIGGLPFLPSATGLVTKMLDELISDSPESAFERATLPKGIEERLSKVEWDRKDVLVGTFRSKAEYQVCMDNRVYYIAANKIKEKDLPIHYIAMFKNPHIFTDSAGIECYGEILESRKVKRKNIRRINLPNGNPEDIFYAFRVKDWITLQHPILPRETGFTHAFTNKFLLENVEYIPELLLKSEAEYRFYMELKRRSKENILNEENDIKGFEVDGSRVLFGDGMIRLVKNDKVIEQCLIREFSQRPNAMFRRLMRYSGK